MSDAFLNMLPLLATRAAHTGALGFVFESLTDEGVRIRMPWRADLVGDPETGVLAGGAVTTVLDHVGGLATWVKLNEFQSIATLDLRVDYMRPARAGEDLFAEAKCFRLTNTIAFVRAWAFETSPDDPVAAAQAAYVLTANAGSRTGVNLKPRGKRGTAQ